MASINTNQFKPGIKLLLDGDPHNILENEFVSREKAKLLMSKDEKSKEWSSGGKNI